MASGLLLASGQVWVVDAIKDSINNISSGLYVGLMTNSTKPAEAAQLPTAAGITEIDELVLASGYSRQLSTAWAVTSGTDPYILGETVTFTASGSWANVNGYFVSQTLAGTDAIWTELFSASQAGARTSGDTILLTPKYEQKDTNE